MAKVVNIDSLTRELKAYEPVLQTLPFDTLQAGLAPLDINVIDVPVKNILMSFERKGGLIRPYKAGDPDDDIDVGEIGKIRERILDVDPCVLALKEFAKNYNALEVITGQSNADNKSKRVPIERLILEKGANTISEDLFYAAFFMVRDTDDISPLGCADGFGEKIAQDISSGLISAANGNYKASGELKLPVDETDTDAIDLLEAWIVDGAHAKLQQNCILRIDKQTLYYCAKALQNKKKYYADAGLKQVEEYISNLLSLTNFRIVTSQILGKGGHMHLTVPGNFEFGMRTRTDADFCQVRDAYKDPNWWQFWFEFEVGTRIKSVHAKSFLTNERTNTSLLSLSGDYQS